MQSSAGLHSPQLRSSLWIAAVALAVLALSLLLAFASATAPHPGPNGEGARRTPVETRFGTQTSIAAPAAPPPEPATPRLWALLAPWTFRIDALAVLGLAAVLIVRRNARRRPRART